MVGPPEPEPSTLNRSPHRGPHDGFLDDFPGYDLIMQPIMQVTMKSADSLRICHQGTAKLQKKLCTQNTSLCKYVIVVRL